MEKNYLVFVVEKESKQQIAECDNLGDCERVIAEYCDERDMWRLNGKELYELHHMKDTFQTQNRKVNFLVENTKSLKKKIEEFLNDYSKMEELDCEDTINYLQDAVDLLQDVLNENNKTIEKEERKGYEFKIFVQGKELQTNYPPLYCTQNEMLHLATGMIYGVRLKYKTAYIGIYTTDGKLVKTIAYK